MIKILAAGLIAAFGLFALPALAEGEPLETSAITGFDPFSPPEGDILFADGTTKGLADFPGELVLATVWFTTCPGCQIEMPRLGELAALLEAEGETRIRVLPISIDDVVFREPPAAALDRVRAYYDRRGLATLPVALDTGGTNAGLLFGGDPVATPTTFFITPSGQIAAVVRGANADWTSPESLAFIKTFLDG